MSKQTGCLPSMLSGHFTDKINLPGTLVQDWPSQTYANCRALLTGTDDLFRNRIWHSVENHCSQ